MESEYLVLLLPSEKIISIYHQRQRRLADILDGRVPLWIQSPFFFFACDHLQSPAFEKATCCNCFSLRPPFFLVKTFFFLFEKLTRQLIPNLYCNYVWLQAFIASRHVRLWVVLLFSLKLCPAISVIWWWHPSVGQVVNIESHFLPWILNSSDFVLKYKSKAFMRQLEQHLLWNNSIFSSHRTCLDVDVTLHIDLILCTLVLKHNVL